MQNHNEFYSQMTDMLVYEIENGADSWRKCWSGSASAMEGIYPRNPVSMDKGQSYRGSNVFWLWLTASFHGWDDSRWGTYNQVKKLAAETARKEGRNIEERKRKRGNGFYYWDVDNDCLFSGGVRKGEKATDVIFWKRLKIKDVSDNGQVVEKFIPMAKFYKVFNYAQCDGLPALPARPAPVVRDNSLDELSQNYFDAQGITLGFGGDRAFYAPSSDRIQMPHKDDFDGEAEFYGTLYHEMAHSTGHKDRLNRPGIVDHIRFGSASYSFEELVAEFTSVFVMAQMGRLDVEDKTFKNSASYLRGWAKKLKKNKDWAGKAATKARHAAEFILQHAEVQAKKEVA